MRRHVLTRTCTYANALRIRREDTVRAVRLAQDELDLDSHGNDLGKRVEDSFDKIVSLFVAARAGQSFHGPDIVVAAEKAGLTFGHMNVFHRLIDRHPEQGPVFITDRGRPAHVLLSIREYQRLTGGHRKIADLLAMPGIEDVELEVHRLRDLPRPADLT